MASLKRASDLYYKHRRDRSIPEEMVQVVKFCRERKEVRRHGVPVSQIALLYSTYSHYREINGLFNRDLSRIHGMLQAFVKEGGQL